MTARFRVALPTDKIQGLRILHALLEAGVPISVPPEALPRLEYLKGFFPMAYEPPDPALPEWTEVGMEHDGPDSWIGSIHRPLIFPHAVPAYLRERWPQERPTRFLFSGLVTPKRKATLDGWMKANWSPGEVGRGAPLSSTGGRIMRRLRALRGHRHAAPRIGLAISASDRGRTWPVKGWDPDYFNEMLHAQMVLCPNGDFVWTYRFFEAALCGAIPVIEDSCGWYDGFLVHTMATPTRDLLWSPEWAEHNFHKACELLTAPVEALAAELTAVARRLSPEP